MSVELNEGHVNEHILEPADRQERFRATEELIDAVSMCTSISTCGTSIGIIPIFTTGTDIEPALSLIQSA